MPSRTSRNDVARLDDIRSACARIVSFTRHKQLPDFVGDPLLQSGVGLQLLIVGEAATHVMESTRKKFPQIPWKKMSQLRNRVAHAYWDVDPLKIWSTIVSDIPKLLEDLGS